MEPNEAKSLCKQELSKWIADNPRPNKEDAKAEPGLKTEVKLLILLSNSKPITNMILKQTGITFSEIYHETQMDTSDDLQGGNVEEHQMATEKSQATVQEQAEQSQATNGEH